MKRLLFFLLVAGSVMSPAARAQVSCPASSGKLICLIPNGLNFTQASFAGLGFLSEAVGSEVSNLPLASPASGIIYRNDPKLNVPVPSDETLGPVLTQRPETIGRHKLYIAATYQFFRFEDIDGLSLKNLPLFISVPGQGFEPTNNRLDLTVHQTTGYLTFGLTSRVDVSLAVPVLDIHEQLTTSGLEYNLTSGMIQPIASRTIAGSVTGIGDVIVAAKGTLWKPKHGGLAFGTEVRLPSGDAMNFLGAGTIGVKPFLSWTYGGRFAPHANIAYQINGESVLASNAAGDKGHLPNRLFYSGGADVRATKWMTVAIDALAQRVFDSQRVSQTTVLQTTQNMSYPSIAVSTGSYNRTDGSVGLKFKPVRNLIVTGNLLVKLDQGGLRARTVVLGGISYTF